MLKDVRNADGKLVCQINEKTGEVVIVQRGCITKIHIDGDGRASVFNARITA